MASRSCKLAAWWKMTRCVQHSTVMLVVGLATAPASLPLQVGTDFLEEEITKFEDLVQSVDVAAFNKV